MIERTCLQCLKLLLPMHAAVQPPVQTCFANLTIAPNMSPSDVNDMSQKMICSTLKQNKRANRATDLPALVQALSAATILRK